MVTRRAFALLRTLIVAPAFVSLWMYFVPKWIAGAHAFANPRPLGWIVVAIGLSAAVGWDTQFALRNRRHRATSGTVSYRSFIRWHVSPVP